MVNAGVLRDPRWRRGETLLPRMVCCSFYQQTPGTKQNIPNAKSLHCSSPPPIHTSECANQACFDWGQKSSSLHKIVSWLVWKRSNTMNGCLSPHLTWAHPHQELFQNYVVFHAGDSCFFIWSGGGGIFNPFCSGFSGIFLLTIAGNSPRKMVSLTKFWSLSIVRTGLPGGRGCKFTKQKYNRLICNLCKGAK